MENLNSVPGKPHLCASMTSTRYAPDSPCCSGKINVILNTSIASWGFLPLKIRFALLLRNICNGKKMVIDDALSIPVHCSTRTSKGERGIINHIPTELLLCDLSLLHHVMCDASRILIRKIPIFGQEMKIFYLTRRPVCEPNTNKRLFATSLGFLGAST